MKPVLANPVRKDGSDALDRLCIEDPQTGRCTSEHGCNLESQLRTASRRMFCSISKDGSQAPSGVA